MSEPFSHYSYEQYPIPAAPRKRRGRQALGLTATAVIALSAGAGAGFALSSAGSSSSATAAFKTVLSTSQIASKVDPGLVDVISTLGYQNETAAGTGIVLTPNGEILTNNHVINGATSVKVTDIGNGKTYEATVIGYDDSKDVAVLQLSGASGLRTAPIGDSSAVGVGDRVVGLGNAGGAGGTPSVAPGDVTALNHSITAYDDSSGISEQLSGLIQSNADIQAGDSGGPLVNEYGAVVGMDTAALSGFQFGNGSGGYNGSSNSGTESTAQGYSIPINTAISIAGQIEAGKASSTIHIGPTAFLGIEFSGNNSATGTGGQQTSGVEISGAVSGSPAAQADLTTGDAITSVAGTSVNSGTSIQQVLEGHHPGDNVTIDWTDTSGQSHSATVTLASGPAA